MAVEMSAQHYAQLIELLNDKIHKLEHDKNEQRKEINRLKAEIRNLSRSKNEARAEQRKQSPQQM